MSRSRKQWVSLALGTAVTVVLLAWVLQGVSWGAVWQTLGRSHGEWFAVGWVAYLGCIGMRAWRWGNILQAQGYRSTFRTRLTANFIGFGTSSVLPSYLGELIRASVLYRKSGVPLEATLGSIVAERMLDILAVLFFLGLPLALHVVPAFPELNTVAVVGLWLLLMIGWVLCIGASRDPKSTAQRVIWILNRLKLSRFCAGAQTSMVHFLQGLGALGRPQRCFILFLETLGAWLLNGVTYWTGLMAFQEHGPGFLGALFIQSGSALAIALPSTPGYIGPFEASLRVLLGLYRIPADVVLSYALALRLIMYVTIPIIAGLLILRLGLEHKFTGIINPQKTPSKY
ncbi:MAG: lysylphosphatidylglycerol synthase transmembrane domain-containing protein [Thermosynechococcaceae cyanobacterium]